MVNINQQLKNISEYFYTHYVSRYWILLIDVFVSTFSTVLVYWSINNYSHLVQSYSMYWWLAGLSLLFSLTSFVLFRTHLGIVRHTTFREIWRIAFAAISKSVLIFLSILFIYSIDNQTSFVFRKFIVSELADIVVTLFFLIMVRVVVSNIYSYLISKSSNKDARKVLIYGVGNDAVSTLGIIEKQSNQYKCAGFMTFSPTKSRKLLCGYNIYEVDNERSFQRVIYSNGISAIVFSSYREARQEKDRILDYAVRRKIEIFIRPNLNTFENGTPITAPIREVKIEDLLGRDEVSINMEEIHNFVTDKVVLVSGAAGSIGSELCRLLLSLPIQKLVMIDSAETPMHNLQLELRDVAPKIEKKFIVADVRSQSRMDNIFSRYLPHVVFHAAAYKHVPLMENNPCEAVNTNVFGTKNMADIATKYGVEKFVMVSTDKAVNPANVMGASKRIAEIYVQSLSKAIALGTVKGRTRFITTRFGNVLGSNGSVIPLFREQIAKGGPLTVTHKEIIRYFMTIPEACRLVMEAATMGKGDEIFVFDMGKPVKIDDLARNMIKLAGLEVDRDIKIEYTGLRPGEKLYEELLNNDENTVPTLHQKIFLAKVRSYVYSEVAKSLEMLKAQTDKMDKNETVAQMKSIVPEFKSCNSRYSKLDK